MYSFPITLKGTMSKKKSFLPKIENAESLLTAPSNLGKLPTTINENVDQPLLHS